MKTKTSGLVAALAVGLGLAAVAAEAAPRGAPAPAVRVRLDGLDLERDADVAVLYQRLQVAARRVCATHDAPGAQAQRDWRECYDAALSGAVAGSGSARLARLHGGAPAPVPLARQDGA